MEDKKQEISDSKTEEICGGYCRTSGTVYFCDDCGANFEKSDNGKCPKCGSTNTRRLSFQRPGCGGSSDAKF